MAKRPGNRKLPPPNAWFRSADQMDNLTPARDIESQKVTGTMNSLITLITIFAGNHLLTSSSYAAILILPSCLRTHSQANTQNVLRHIEWDASNLF